MKVGDLVKCTADNSIGIVIEIASLPTMWSVQVLWTGGDLRWIGNWKVDVISESR